MKPDVKRQKNDMADAEAICEAVSRANMRFVPTKTPEQQSCLMLHRTRHLLIRQQTAVINSIRVHLAEFGIVAPVGRKGVMELLHVVADPSDKRLPEVARPCLSALGTQLLHYVQPFQQLYSHHSIGHTNLAGAPTAGGSRPRQRAPEALWLAFATFRRKSVHALTLNRLSVRGRDVDGTGK